MSILPSKQITVFQREYGYTNSSNKKSPFIGTALVSCCLAMFVYDSIFKEAAVAHFDGSTATMENVDLVFEQIKRPTHITFIGGYKNYVRGIDALVQKIDEIGEKYHSRVDRTRVFEKQEGQGFDYIRIDTRTGKIDFPFIHVAPKRIEFRLGQIPLKKTIDARGQIILTLTPLGEQTLAEINAKDS